jgi:type II secretory pathway predicted ATPase ExeA
MFWQHWKLNCSPFDNVPDPKMYCDRNPALEDAISEVLFAIDEGNDCLAVIVGDVGLGKTLALRVILDELPQERFKIVFITNPALTFNQILREIVGQLKGQPADTRFKDALQEEFNRLLFEAASEGKRVVIMIDEANVLSRDCLQNLRLLTNMQDDERNLVSIVMAGQLELGKKLEAQGMENLFQRVGVYCRIKPLATPEIVRDYIEFRMERAGAVVPIFTPEAAQRIHHHSGGVPRLVNKLCKLALKAGETNGLELIDAEFIDRIALMFDKAKVSPEAAAESEGPEGETRPEPLAAAKIASIFDNREAAPAAPAAEEAEAEADGGQPAAREPERQAAARESAPAEASASPPPVEEPLETAEPQAAGEGIEMPSAAEEALASGALPEPPRPQDMETAQAASPAAQEVGEPEAQPPSEGTRPQAAPPAPEPQGQAPAQEPEGRQGPRLRVVKADRETQQPPLTPEQLNEIVAGLPEHVVASVRDMDEAQLVKLAGELAAKLMWRHEKAIRLSHGDPIDFWERSRTQIAAALRATSAGENASAAS